MKCHQFKYKRKKRIVGCAKAFAMRRIRRRARLPGSIVSSLFLRFCRRLFSRLESVTSWSHNYDFDSYIKPHLQYKYKWTRNSQKRVKMATQSTVSVEIIADTFVDQYYPMLQRRIDQSYRFYKEQSVLSWPLPDGKIKCVTSFEEINEFIVSSHFKNSKVEVTTVSAQSSVAGGILVVVTAFLVGQDESRKRFSQSFFLAPQETGYFVLNDIFRFVDGEESSIIVIEEKTDENASASAVVPLACESKDEDSVDEVRQKTSIIIESQQEKQGDEMTQNEAPKVTYASVIKQGRLSSAPTNAPLKIAANAAGGLPLIPKISQPNSFLQALTASSSLSGTGHVSKVAPDNNDNQHKSIYIGGLPANTTISDLYAVVKQFGPLNTNNIQLKTYEDGYCCGFVHFQDAISAKNAVQAHRITVKGKEAYITFKKLNKGSSERANSPSKAGLKVEIDAKEKF